MTTINENWIESYKKKLSVLSVITLRLLRTKKTHTGAVKTGFLKGVGGHHFAEVECQKMS